MPATIKDLARHCGISISTVSKVFNGYTDISEATRSQVLQAAREIGYKPNALARALKTNRTYNLGVLFVDDRRSGLTHPFFASVLNAFKAEAEARGYDITFINHNIGAMEMTYLEHCRYRNVDGVCLACVDFRAAEVIELVNSGIPCVTVDYVFEGRPAVLSDNRGGMEALVAFAAKLGHRRIAYVHGQRNSMVTEDRLDGFRRAMAARGLPLPEGFVRASLYGDAEDVRRQTLGLLESPDRPTCVLLPDDAAAFGALEAARSLGMRVPEAVSFAGYDGIPFSQVLSPRLTTIRQDASAMGREAARMLVDRVERPGGPVPAPVTIPGRLLTGESVAPPAGED